MAVATNEQMQRYADERMRVRSEQFRNLRISAADDRAAIDDIYQRAVSNSRWNDARTDGVPHLLQSGNNADPDDMLNFNSFLAMFEKFMAGTFESLGEANSAAANWQVVQDACVRPVGA
jgi:hypothetical protein